VNRCWLEGWSSGCELRRGSAALSPEPPGQFNCSPITNTHCHRQGFGNCTSLPPTPSGLWYSTSLPLHRQGFGRKEKTALILSIYLIWWLLGLGDVGTHKVTQLQTTMLATFPRIHFITHTEEVSLASAEVLVRRWAPNVRMHRSTSFMPISAHDYITHCAPPHDRWEAVISQPRLGQNVSLSPEVALIRDKHRTGAFTPTVHTIVRKLVTANVEGLKHLDGCYLIYYIFLYAHQPDARVFGCCMPIQNTGHVADLEWVTVLAAPSGLKLLWTFYSAHGDAESSWVPATEPLTTMAPHIAPDVYVALDVQANYPTPGRKNRIWFITADLCASASDPKLDYVLEHLEPSHPFRLFAGHLGPDGIAAPGRGGGNRFDLPGSITHHINTAYSRRMFRFS
jgi:hypothetical protein